jgi:hypothetical protein
VTVSKYTIESKNGESYRIDFSFLSHLFSPLFFSSPSLPFFLFFLSFLPFLFLLFLFFFLLFIETRSHYVARAELELAM